MAWRRTFAGTALGADLDDAAVLAGRGDHLPAFPDVVGEGLLDVDVLARLAGPDGGQGVPVVGRGDGHGVDGLVVEQLAEVAVGCDLFAPVLEGLELVVQDLLVHVAQGGDPDARDRAEPGDELAAASAHAAGSLDPAEPDHGHADLGVGPGRLGGSLRTWRQPRQREGQPSSHGTLQEVSTRCRFACCWLHIPAPDCVRMVISSAAG